MTAPVEPTPAAPPTTPVPTPPTAADSFPGNTPVEQMNPGQQAAYWKAQSQKHQGRSESNYALLRTLGVSNADEATAAKGKLTAHEQAEAERATETEKREKAARDAATADADALYRPKLAETAFRIAIGDRMTDDEVNDFIVETNMSSFIKDDGNVDTVKVLARVAKLAPAKGNQQSHAPRGPVVPGHGPGGPAPVKPGDSARAALAARGIKVD